jgi:hypothetical protein
MLDYWRVDKGSITFQGIQCSRVDLKVDPSGKRFSILSRTYPDMGKYDKLSLCETQIAAGLETMRESGISPFRTIRDVPDKDGEE